MNFDEGCLAGNLTQHELLHLHFAKFVCCSNGHFVTYKDCMNSHCATIVRTLLHGVPLVRWKSSAEQPDDNHSNQMPFQGIMATFLSQRYAEIAAMTKAC